MIVEFTSLYPHAVMLESRHLPSAHSLVATSLIKSAAKSPQGHGNSKIPPMLNLGHSMAML